MIIIPGVDPNMIANNLEPYRPTHPGEVLKDEIEYRGISQKQLATAMGVPYTLLNEVLNAKRQMNAELALLVEAALDLPAEPFIRMQARYNMLTSKRNSAFMERVQNVKRIAANVHTF
jgi:addiction module HigA family antidote